MAKIQSTFTSDTGERRIANLQNLPDSSMHTDTYTVTNASTLQRLEELDDVDLEQLRLEDLEDFDSDDLESVDEFELDDTDLGSLDENECRTLKQYLDSRYDVRIMYQGRQISRQHAFQIITPDDAAFNTNEQLQSDDEIASTTTGSGENEVAETPKGDGVAEKVKEPPVIEGDDWMLWCDGAQGLCAAVLSVNKEESRQKTPQLVKTMLETTVSGVITKIKNWFTAVCQFSWTAAVSL
ncbi:hypothetical protein IWZ01DRAFT_483587 [Phyllosticta capitalensis]